MKNMFKSALLMGAALTMGFTSCSKDEAATNGNGDEKTVMFSFSQEGQFIPSRAAGSHVADQTAVTINDAYIYFVDAGNSILERVQIVTSGAGAANGYDADAKTVGMTPAKTTGGTPITGVAGATRKVYVVANYPGGTYPATGNIEDLMKAITFNSQFDNVSNDGGVQKVTVFGGNSLTTVDAATNKYSSKVTISPIAARIEIGRITGKQDGTGKGLKSFDLKGIFIDNYYTTFGGTTLVSQGTDNTKFESGHASFAYGSLDEILSDYAASALVAQGTPARIYAAKASANAETDVWAYNLVAPEATGTQMARLVIYVENAVWTDGAGNDDDATYATKKFLTIRNFYKSGETDPLEQLERGWIYRIKDLQFAETDLTENPNMNMIDVTVEVDVLPWYADDVDYDFN